MSLDHKKHCSNKFLASLFPCMFVYKQSSESHLLLTGIFIIINAVIMLLSRIYMRE